MVGSSEDWIRLVGLEEQLIAIPQVLTGRMEPCKWVLLQGPGQDHCLKGVPEGHYYKNDSRVQTLGECHVP